MSVTFCQNFTLNVFIFICFPLQLFCCGGRRRRKRRSKYESEHPHALHVVYVDSDGSASRGAKGKQDKKSSEKRDAKKSEENEGRSMKKDGDKDGYKNDGYESDGKNKVCVTLLIPVHYVCYLLLERIRR